MPSSKLTARTISAVRPKATPFILYDPDLPGFGLRVMPTGFKSWVVEWRPKGAGRAAGKRRLTLGSAAVVPAIEARSRAKDTLAAVRQGHDPLDERARERATTTVNALAANFLRHVEKMRKPSTAALYKRALEMHVLPKLGTKKAVDVTTANIARLHDELESRPIMANRVLAVVGSMYGWGAKQKLVPKGTDPTTEIERNPEQGRERYLSTGELERLGRALRDAETIGLPWDVADGPKSKHLAKPESRRTVLSPYAVAAIRLLILTGCRLREILHLRWDEVDAERGMLHLPDSKTGRKSVVLNAPALEVLAGIPRLGSFVIAGKPPKDKRDAERPRSDLKKPWEAIRRSAKLDGVRIHDLRHSFASVGAGAGLGLPIVGKLLGHTQASTTQKYAHLDNDPLRRATNTIGATLAAALAGKSSASVVPIERTRKGNRSRG